MKLYGTIKSERAEKGQGGNEYLEIEISNESREEIALIKVIPGNKNKIIFSINDDLAELEEGKAEACKCTDALCAKCLLLNCKDRDCKIHPEKKKKEFREMYKKR